MRTKKEMMPPKALTNDQIEYILDARDEGKSIKKIAKELHISDRRISAFLAPYEKQRNELIKEYDNFGTIACHDAGKSLREVTAALAECFLDTISDVFQAKSSRESIAKNVKKNLDGIAESLHEMVMNIAIVTMWAMPPDKKMLWADLLNHKMKFIKNLKVDCECEAEECKATKPETPSNDVGTTK